MEIFNLGLEGQEIKNRIDAVPSMQSDIADLKSKEDKDTVYDDSELVNRVSALEAKEDNDTVYDDSELVNRVSAIEAKEDKDTIYDDSELASRVSALEAKEDNDTVYDDADIRSLISQMKTRIELLESTNTTMQYASTSDAITSIDSATAKTTDLVVTSDEAIEAMTSDNYYKSIVAVGVSADSNINLYADDKVVVDGLDVVGDYDGTNHGKLNFKTPELTVSNVTISGATAYNVFEGSQRTDTEDYATKEVNLSAVTVSEPTLQHNVMNVYTPAENANINISDSTFNLDVNNTNVLRLSNYLNKDNVTVTFTNVDWTYEQAASDSSDFKWAGLIIYQPAGKDVALSGDYSHLSTWKFVFDNCKYNGEKVTKVNFGEHSQVIYAYNLGGSKTVTDISLIEGITIEFK